MTVRAATANLTDERDDAERRQAFTDIERIGRETTTELRNMLTVLRAPSDSPAPLHPTRSLTDLPRIIETAQSTGLTVTLKQGALGDVSSGVQLTICTVVQEALANTLRHSGRTRSDISIQRDYTSITIDVRDAGATPGWSADQGTGNGLRRRPSGCYWSMTRRCSGTASVSPLTANVTSPSWVKQVREQKPSPQLVITAYEHGLITPGLARPNPPTRVATRWSTKL